MTFAATHTVGGGGAATWAAPDPTLPDGPRLDAWLPVEVIEYKGDWAHVRCENGWEAWTDGRSLMAAGAAGPPPAAPASGYVQPTAQVPAAQPVAQPAAQPAYQQPVDVPTYQPATDPTAVQTAYPQQAGPPVRAAGPGGLSKLEPKSKQQVQYLGAGGGVLAAISAWVPWYSLGGFSAKGWDLPLMPFISGNMATAKLEAPWIGMFVLLAAVGVLAAFDYAPGWLLIAGGASAVVPALFFVLRFATDKAFKGVDWGIGGPMALIGGGAVMYAGWLLLKPTLGARR